MHNNNYRRILVIINTFTPNVININIYLSMILKIQLVLYTHYTG